jgi:hypothetical protein
MGENGGPALVFPSQKGTIRQNHIQLMGFKFINLKDLKEMFFEKHLGLVNFHREEGRWDFHARSASPWLVRQIG